MCSPKHTIGGYLACDHEVHETLYRCAGSSAQQTGDYQWLLTHLLHVWNQNEIKSTGALAIVRDPCMRRLTAAQKAALSQGADTIKSALSKRDDQIMFQGSKPVDRGISSHKLTSAQRFATLLCFAMLLCRQQCSGKW